MDWTQIIITALTLLFTGGGLVTIVTLNDKKMSAMLENVREVLQSNAETNKRWQEIVAEGTGRRSELKADIAKRDEKIEEKDRKISELQKEKEAALAQVDLLRTKYALSEMMKCDVIGCTDRRPPFGARKTSEVFALVNNVGKQEKDKKIQKDGNSQ